MISRVLNNLENSLKRGEIVNNGNLSIMSKEAFYLSHPGENLESIIREQPWVVLENSSFSMAFGLLEDAAVYSRILKRTPGLLMHSLTINEEEPWGV